LTQAARASDLPMLPGTMNPTDVIAARATEASKCGQEAVDSISAQRIER
jgi:2-keto-3-deoxy-6-phosphogluconate aldolase